MRQESKVKSTFQRYSSFTLMVLFAILQFLLIGVAFLGGFLYYQIRYDDPQVENAQIPVLAEAFTLL